MNTFEQILRDIPPGAWMILCFASLIVGMLIANAMRPRPGPEIGKGVQDFATAMPPRTPSAKDIEERLRALGAQEKPRTKRRPTKRAGRKTKRQKTTAA